MTPKFESDYRARLLRLSFEDQTSIQDLKSLNQLKTSWLSCLATWHSPYKALIDFNKVQTSEKLRDDWERLWNFLKGFHLRKVVGFSAQASQKQTYFPCEVFANEEEAAKALGIRDHKVSSKGDFRSLIQFDNHFEQQVVELAFRDPVVIDNREKVSTLKSKLMNNLNQWHSTWNLLIDCSHLKISPDLLDDFEKTLVFFRGFFLGKVAGYNNLSKETYPFPSYRARHRAAAELKSKEIKSGRTADCSSRKSTKPPK